jgi:topoisomerase IV subunit B
MTMNTNIYSEDSIRTLEWNEHIRLRPGMYVGKLGDGASPDDGIYILLKETIDNSIDEYLMGFGKKIVVRVDEEKVEVRDFGRGIPLGKLVDAASKMNTGAKYDSKAFQKSVGLNGVGIKAVNALCTTFEIACFRDGLSKKAHFERGKLIFESKEEASKEKNGTQVVFYPDNELFGKYKYKHDYIENLLKNYTFLNAGLTIDFNGVLYRSENGLLDLLNEHKGSEPIYPIMFFKSEDFEMAMAHGNQYDEEYHTFVNGQHTTQGGTHLIAFKDAIVKTIREFYNKTFEPSDIRGSIMAAISIRIQEPVFESQTKTKLGSKDIQEGGPSVQKFIHDFVKKHEDDHLHKNPQTADILLKKIQDNEKERKAISGVKKIARERAKKASLHNKKLRDCRIHFNSNHEKKLDSTIFITEGDSASGSITKSRDVNTQAVFSLKGKPLNAYGLSKKIVYENEEFNLLQAALNIEDGIEQLRYNKIVIATDADVDGMHIRLLLLTFFLQFFPNLIREGHVYILQTPLFRVRNKQKTMYCYSEEERWGAIKEIKNPEITRFKGLGEISPDEFIHFIGKDIRLDPVYIKKEESISEILAFYMGKNTPDRQNFIIDNLRVDEEMI